MTISGEAHRRQFADFIEAIEEDREPIIDGLEGKKALEIILAVYEASLTGETVHVKRI